LYVEKLTWAGFESLITVLKEKIVSSGKVFDNVYGIPRGGLVTAVVLSHQLGLPLLTVRRHVTASTLVVDDISESGKTLLPFVRRGCIIATLHVVHNACVIPNFVAKVRNTDWIVYPWEIGKE